MPFFTSSTGELQHTRVSQFTSLTNMAIQVYDFVNNVNDHEQKHQRFQKYALPRSHSSSIEPFNIRNYKRREGMLQGVHVLDLECRPVVNGPNSPQHSSIKRSNVESCGSKIHRSTEMRIVLYWIHLLAQCTFHCTVSFIYALDFHVHT
jgi:hypothetical protein